MARQQRPRRPAGQLFLGGIAATGNKAPAQLPRGFAELQRRYVDAMDAYNQRRLTTSSLAQTLAALRIEDTAGGEWTIGATSGSWYRRMPGLGWATVEPPGVGVVAKGSEATVDEHGRVTLPPPSDTTKEWDALLNLDAFRQDVTIAPLWDSEAGAAGTSADAAQWENVTTIISEEDVTALLGEVNDETENDTWRAGTVTWTSTGGAGQGPGREWEDDREVSDILKRGTLGSFDNLLDED